jgi:hypothetical protein
LAGVAFALTLAGVVGTLLAVALLWRLQRDFHELDAAERFEAAHLSRVVQRYVPLELRTRIVGEEIALARQFMGAMRPRWRRIAVLSGVIMLCGATAAYVAVRRNQTAVAVAASRSVANPAPILEKPAQPAPNLAKPAQPAPNLAKPAANLAKPAVNLDVLKTVQGVWGWRADALESCQENPQTISVTPDRKKLSVRYSKPFQNGAASVTNLDFDVVSTKPDVLVLSLPNASTATRLVVTLQFLDADTFSLTRSDEPMKTSGTIVRCPPPPPAENGVAH